MKNFKHTYLLILVSILLVGTGCRTVVDWDVPNSETTVVVESIISTQVEPWEVKLTMTQDYFAKEAPPAVTDAEVIISDDQGNSDTLIHLGRGTYVSAQPKQAVPGVTYTLNVNAMGKTYTATDRCREQLPLDTVFYAFFPDNNGFIERGYYVFEIAQEIQPRGDFYWWEVYKNDTLQDDFGFITDTDEFANFSFFNQNFDLNDLGNINPDFAPRPFPFNFEQGDTIRIEQNCINRGFYDFIVETQIQQNRAGSPFDAPPANPITNISNGGWGYFSVVNTVSGSVIIK